MSGFDPDFRRAIKSLDQHELRRLMMYARGLIDGGDGDGFGVGGSYGPKVTLRRQEVRCGRDECTKCPHGPYWYAFWREGDKVRSKYIGKDLSALDDE